MPKAFFCNACGRQLTAALTMRSGKDPSVTAPDFVDREPLTQQGTVYKSYEPMVRSFGDEPPAPLEFAPQFWINPGDLTDAVRETRLTGRLSGCCGLAGHDGPNQMCECGAEVGTLQTDCFTPFVFIPEPAATAWAEVSSQIGGARS